MEQSSETQCKTLNEILLSDFVSITKGEIGTPGEIKGSIINKKEIGKIDKNTSFGIVGKITDINDLKIDLNNEYDILPRNEIEEGNAVILCELDDGIKEYEINIKKIYLDNNFDNKSMVIEITDDELLEKTGGIIRGLSGAPILQEGKFVGAITNVLVSNPQIGYAIFGDLMIKQIVE